MQSGLLGAIMMLIIIVVAFAFMFGGRKGPSRLFRFLFAPSIGCVGKIIQAVVTIVILGLVFVYAVPHAFAPGWLKLPSLPAITPPASSTPQEDPQRSSVILEVPFNKQELPTSGMKNNICGYASLGMAAGYACGFQPSVETNVKILQHLGLDPDGHQLSTASNIKRAGKEMYGLDLSLEEWSIDQIKSELAGGHPLIAGTTAREIPRAIRGYDYSGGHYLVVIGYDQDSIIVNDPGTRNGSRKHYQNQYFENAFRAEGSQVIVGFRR